MRFRWEWLRPVLTVPYVPTLGPVHPSVLTEDLFADILVAAERQRFLRYDKDVRWSDAKDETVLTQDIAHRAGETLIPTLVRRGQVTVKVHVFGMEPDSRSVAAELAAKLCATHGAAKSRVVWFLGPEQDTYDGPCTRVQLKDFTTQLCTEPEPGVVSAFEDCPTPVRADFGAFAQRMAADGFAFLHRQMQAGVVGPVLVATHEGRVAGAIGPMEIRPDAVSARQLMPQYFGVLPEHRGHGFGRALWRAAMHWGHVHSASYQLLQTEVGGASDRLCQSEGLTSLGIVCSAAQ
ncbi:GNAT family N-acetyltransferase [Streptomyces sp. NPDC046909]|uniref:GNAT family N-acetyltransferase n=1 Tax=Streptomyces sp. NPDC046909 TaxID=3155617 RepID=UPI0033EF58A8